MNKATKKLTPDLSHRLGKTLPDATPFALRDTVSDLASRATGILTIVSCEFTKGQVSINDENLFYSLQSAIAEVNDIVAVVEDYCRKTQTERAQQ